ncbi:DUF2333 family protein [Desulfobotulus sp. H1]|uniref:DUF2333 family protein n=1 Tax=Desulfobotulus pelophilus TaxID=2823377 RepID=A0ABT3NB52_9BACT|nr:DUF2333 family protein [Desulfobotulus pelophilus]MCW7754688.1 DUF2333 family protein [Desulfobotulus pelophilus]
MHNDRDTENSKEETSSFGIFATRQAGKAIFFTLFGLWLTGTIFGIMRSTDSPNPIEAAPSLSSSDREGQSIIRPGSEGHVQTITPRETTRTEMAAETPARSSRAASLPPPNTATSQNVVGWAFVEAAMQPMHHELYERFWGWRPNDLIRPTDNVNNFQLGTLEVTRRTAVKLAEDISRTGSTASFNTHLEQAMNWFMIRPTKFWFPSAESKYKAGLREMGRYQEQLAKGDANFFNRSDNLIPLLIAYKNLLGSCNENLIKSHESDGRPVSFFKADDYFYYSQGVANAMSIILEAVEHDFYPMLQNRDGLDSLRKAIYYCKKAEEIKPLIILNSDMSGLLANHRANLATHISLARFYISVLIATIST